MPRIRLKRQAKAIPQLVTDLASDRGATGLAMLMRPCELEKAATGVTALGREQTDRLKYQDSSLVDRLYRVAQISQRQHDAAVKFLEMWTAASVEKSVVAAYGERTGIHEAPTECDGTVTAADVYRRFVRPFRGKGPLSPHKLEIVESVMMGRHPGLRWLATAQAAFDDLADHWKLSE